MIKRINPIIQLFIIFLIQISIVNNGLLFGFYPNLVLVYIIYITQKSNNLTSIVITLMAGILLDTVLSPNFGIRTLSFFIISIVILYIRDYIFEDNIFIAVLYTLLAVTMYFIISNIIYFFLSYNISISQIFASIFSLETIFSILFFVILQKLNMKYKINFENKFLEKGKLIETITKKSK